MYNKVHLIMRHGITDFNVSKRIQGQLEAILTEEGKNQVKMVGNFINQNTDFIFKQIVTSPLRRTKDSAEIISDILGINIKEDDRLKELGRGILEGKYKSKLNSEELLHTERFKEDPWSYRIPGSETFSDLKVRVKNLIEDLKEKEINAIIISHGYVIRMLLYLFSDQKENIDSFKTPHNRLFIIRVSNTESYSIEQIDV